MNFANSSKLPLQLFLQAICVLSPSKNRSATCLGHVFPVENTWFTPNNKLSITYRLVLHRAFTDINVFFIGEGWGEMVYRFLLSTVLSPISTNQNISKSFYDEQNNEISKFIYRYSNDQSQMNTGTLIHQAFNSDNQVVLKTIGSADLPSN